MPRYCIYILMLAAFAVWAVAMCGCDNPVSRSGTKGDDATTTDSPSMSHTKLKALYERAKAAGEQGS